jgi:hypothetical protein
MTVRICAALIGVTLLAACNTPPPGFAGVDPVRVDIGQSSFDVRVKEGRAHALRLNAEFAPNIKFVGPRAALAMTQVSGCDVVQGSMAGDAIFITADLDCDAISTETSE